MSVRYDSNYTTFINLSNNKGDTKKELRTTLVIVLLSVLPLLVGVVYLLVKMHRSRRVGVCGNGGVAGPGVYMDMDGPNSWEMMNMKSGAIFTVYSGHECPQEKDSVKT